MQSTKPPRIDLPKRARDRPNLGRVFAVATLAFAAGVTAAYGLVVALGTETDETPAPATESLTVVLPAADAGVITAPDAQPNAATFDAGGTPEVAVEKIDGGPASAETPSALPSSAASAAAAIPHEGAPPTDEVPENAPPLPAEAAPQTAPAVRPARTRASSSRVRHGIVAYTRCDGLERHAGRFPCPRDAQLERDVSRLIDALPSCGELASQSGRAVLRIEIGSQVQRSARFSAPREGGLDADALNRCAARDLGRLATTFEPERMIVRFELELR